MADRVVIRIYVDSMELEDAAKLKTAIDSLLESYPEAETEMTITSPLPERER